jgi:predicted NBD/HSP70 family sugar kinase
MYLGIDIGGTKTLLASLTNDGVITEKVRFPTPATYEEFILTLADNVANMSTKGFSACGVGAPGRIDRRSGVAIAMGNLKWENVPLKNDISKLIKCPVVVDNDANLAGLSEAMLLKRSYNRVLYVTISTGIGTGIIINQSIDPAFADSEGGQILLEHNGKLESWEDFAAGSAIVARYGKQARDINNGTTWKHIAHDIALGLIDLIAVIQPEVIVFGGSVSAYLERFETPLKDILKQYETPLVPVPPLLRASRPDEAVLYGCYDLAKSVYGKSTR